MCVHGVLLGKAGCVADIDVGIVCVFRWEHVGRDIDVEWADVDVGIDTWGLICVHVATCTHLGSGRKGG
jgi:hypothetical protein